MSLLNRLHVVSVISLTLAVPFITGCAMFKGSESPEERILDISAVPVDGEGLESATQYAFSTGLKVGGNTFEVYLQNKTQAPITIKSVYLNDEELPVPKPAARVLKKTSLTLDGMEVPLDVVKLPENDIAVWWQFYPCEKASPGETIALQICTREPATFQRSLKLQTDAGETIDVVLPRFREPDRFITAVTFASDYREMHVQYRSASPIKRLWISNREVKRFRILASAESGTPSMAWFQAPFRIKEGMPLHVKVAFEDGKERHALLRAISGIKLDTPPDASPSGRQCRKLGLDTGSDVIMIPYDVTCDDSISKQNGVSARAVVPERLREYQKHPGRLCGIGYCTAAYEQMWNIYGPLSDAVYAKPYSLGWGNHVQRFIEEEEDSIQKAQSTSAPRPFFWIPQRFPTSAGRYIEPEEMRILAWISLLRGGKGIRYNFWRNSATDPFEGCPLLQEAIATLNNEIRLHAKMLSPLVFVSEKTQGREREGQVKIYTSWAGERGILLMVRNMDYQTDDKANDGGRSPRFHVNPINEISIQVELPDWLRFSGAKDLPTAKEIISAGSDQKIELKLQNLNAFQLIWLENSQFRTTKQ